MRRIPLLRRSRLVRRLLALQVVTVLLTIGGLAALGVWGVHRVELDAAGRLTGATAAAVAGDPAVVDALSRGGDVPSLSARMQPLAERARTASGTAFVVVMSRDGVRYSHAEPDRIGAVYLGTIAPALDGRSLTEVYTGTLGPSVRTVVPVFSGARVVGAVSVGVLQTTVGELAVAYLPWILAAAALALAVGVGLAVLTARRLRRQTLGLEPEEITAAYTHHDAVLHAVGEGLLVVDDGGRLVVVNAQARRLLGVDGDAGTLSSMDTDPAVRAVLLRGWAADLHDEPALAGERVVLVNSRAAGPAAGEGTRVFTLRDRTELADALRERDDARDTVAALAGQAHEFANRMQTVLTLMDLGDTADARRAGTAALDRSRGPDAVVVAEVADPVLAALLADKAWAAEQADVELTVVDAHDPDTVLPFGADDLVSLAGNLVDNALEAVAGHAAGRPRRVGVTLRPSPDGGLVLEVADTGPGIDGDVAAELFTYGFSTRARAGGRPRGIGLALVDRISRRLGGTVAVVPGPDGGTVFTVVLPAPGVAAGVRPG